MGNELLKNKFFIRVCCLEQNLFFLVGFSINWKAQLCLLCLPVCSHAWHVKDNMRLYRLNIADD